MVRQPIEDRYIDKSQLSDLLTKLFGSKWSFEIQGEWLVLEVPEEVSQDEINKLQEEYKKTH
ncbi:hypothetical protein NA56DRAFT_753835 [Hyaloscypha hepaticicola]|uniref:Uncharacterized protein n=1 Tax=Hyaloscypha hepaticicola TaxID=2082293 RepID=A0A2J6PNI0_9HELO|nr:hypothetical protein NA56DRAFT_753835 [Hyaloscypha hepaticicola]